MHSELELKGIPDDVQLILDKMNRKNISQVELDTEYFLSLYKFRIQNMENPQLHADQINNNPLYLRFIAQYKVVLNKIDAQKPLKVSITSWSFSNDENFHQLIGADGIFVALINGWK